MSRPGSTTDADTARPPPKVVLVPPPKVATIDWRWFAWALLALLMVGASWGTIGKWSQAVTVLACVLFLPGVFWLTVRRNVRFNRRCKRFAARHSEVQRDGDCGKVARELGRQWYGLSRPPTMAALRTALTDAGVDATRQAIVFWMAAIDLPEAGDVRFEPEVVQLDDSPRRAQVRPLLVGLIVFACAVSLAVSPLVPDEAKDYIFWAGLLAAATVVQFWRSIVEPRYLRLAPGIIQVLDYQVSKSRPAIRPYPLIGGTIVVVQQTVRGIEFRLWRAKQNDVVAIERFDPSDKRWERIGQALLSRAPIPALSDEALLG